MPNDIADGTETQDPDNQQEVQQQEPSSSTTTKRSVSIESTSLEQETHGTDDEENNNDGRGRRPRRGYSALGRSGTNLLADIAAHLERPENLDDAEAAAARFDCTPFRLWLLFQSVDLDQNGYISKQALCHALSSASNMTAKSSTAGAADTVSLPVKSSTSAQSQEDMQVDDIDDDDEGLEDFLYSDEIQALEELFDRIVSEDDCNDPNQTKSDNDDNDDDEKTTEHRNCPSGNSRRGISYPQFCRIMRYLWLQQLLDPDLDNKFDPDFHYKFECVDYAWGYYRQRSVTGNASEKRTRDFFMAPRHGHARMRWIDVPSGTFPHARNGIPNKTTMQSPRNDDTANPDNEQHQSSQENRTLLAGVSSDRAATFRSYSGGFDPYKNYQTDCFRITILRLAVKYRFHPTSIEDAIDLEFQEPKVKSFDHSLLDLGNFHCGTISWIRHGGNHNSRNSLFSEKNHTGGSSTTPGAVPRSVVTEERTPGSVPRPRPQQLAERYSSTASFQSFHKETTAETDVLTHIPDFVLAEGEEDVNINEGRHYFITIPMFELSRRSQTSLDLYRETSDLLPFMQLQPLVIEVNEATLGIFVASNPDANLVVTCSTKWRPTIIKPFELQKNEQARPRPRKTTGSKPNLGEDFGFNDESSDNNSDDSADEFIQRMLQDEKLSLERVKNLLKKRHSIQRHRNSSWLMHAIVDAVVDNLGPICKIYEAQCQLMSNRLYELQHRLSKREVKEMITMRRNLEWLQHELGPFARVIRHLIDDSNIGAEVTHYLEDVEDNLARTLEELSSYANECATLKDEYNAYLDRRMNDILYFLTLVTTLIVPAQFFTGYYGMNFENSNGDLGDPLLRKGTVGVGIFWAIITGFTLLVVLVMHRCSFFERELE